MTQQAAPVALTIGVFDGVHRGHQDLIQRMTAVARLAGLSPQCVTFDPDPETLLRPDLPCLALTSLAERERLLMAQGVDDVEVVDFTPSVAALSAEAFLDELRAAIDFHELWVGADFALGHQRTGTVEILRAIGGARQFTVNAVDLLSYEGRAVSSTWIREALAEGNVELAASLLGRPYVIEGVVETGAQRGRQLGFPTANVAPPSGRALPADGVYFVEAQFLSPPERGPMPTGIDRLYYGVVNLGGRPTFNESERLVETHLLDFQGDVYGATMSVAFLQQLRGIRRFAGVDELRDQIELDVAAARKLAAS